MLNCSATRCELHAKDTMHCSQNSCEKVADLIAKLHAPVASQTTKRSEAFREGYEAGYEHGIHICFGHEVIYPYFDTADEQHDWFDGFERGFATVD